MLILPDNVVSWTEFTDGVLRAVYEELGGRQYVIDDDDERVYGRWYYPRIDDGADRPMFVDERPF